MISKIMLEKNKKELENYIITKLSEYIEPSKLLEDKNNYLEEWMKEAMKLIEQEFTPVLLDGETIGASHEDYEFSEKYNFLKSLKTRFPKNCYITPSGIGVIEGNKKYIIVGQPIVPVSILTIGNGNYETYYKWANKYTGARFVAPIKEIKFIKIYKEKFYEYTNNCILLNQLQPKRIEEINYA